MNETLKEILHEMCSRVGADAETIDFKARDWYISYVWTQEEQNSFRDWMINYLLADRKRIKDMAEFPSLMRNKKAVSKLVDWFIFDYGFKVNYSKQE